jgi:hypothetical protein
LAGAGAAVTARTAAALDNPRRTFLMISLLSFSYVGLTTLNDWSHRGFRFGSSG